MRLLYVVHQYPPEHLGGTELYAQMCAQAMAAQGHHVAILTRISRAGSGLEVDERDAVTIYRLWDGTPSPGQRYLTSFQGGKLLAGFEQVLAQFQPDLVHLLHLMGLPLQILDRLQAARLPYIITLLDYWWVCANAQLLTNYDETVCAGPKGYVNCTQCAVARAGGGAAWAGAPLLWASLAQRNRWLARGLQGAQTLLAPMRFVARWYREHGVPADRVQMLPWGVDRPADFARQRTRQYPLRLAYIGGLAWQKGLHVMVDAVTAIGDDVEFWIAGEASPDPAYGEELRGRAGSNVRFLGRLSRAEVWDTLAQVDAVVVPSLWYETFSLLLHEAFAAGVPVIASNLGVMAEALTPGVNGLLVPPGDVAAWRATLQALVDDPAQLAQLATGIERPLTVDEHMAQLADVYATVVAEETPRSGALRARNDS